MKRQLVGLFATLTFTGAASAQEPRPLASPGSVTLPLAEYERLLDRAARPVKRPEPPPIPSVLARAEIRLRVSSDLARATMTLDGEVFRAGATKVPLLSGGTLLDARSAGRALPLVYDSKGASAILPGPGAFSVTLDWGAALAAEPGRASFVLPVPPAGSVRAIVEVPGEQAEIRLEPGLITRRTASGGKTLIEATLEPGSRARVSWSARDTVTAPREARFLSDVKTLVTIGEASLRLASLVDVSVLQGDPSRFELRLPPGFEVTEASGVSLDRTEERPGALVLVVREPQKRRHQFLIGLEHSNGGGSFKADAPLPTLEGAQRETGEAAVEGTGTLELSASEGEGMRRMDVREADDALKRLARQSLLAAFRYQHKTAELTRLALDVKRFPDASVLAAVVERAVITTLLTTEGRALTEVSLTVRNHAQPFLKVALPPGATLLSADVAGEGVKPVTATDGTRVPLLRAGFRPEGAYSASFVYLQSGTALGRKGLAALALPRLDVPVDVLQWELFLPDRYKVSNFGGNALGAALVSTSGYEYGVPGGVSGGVAGGVVGGVVGGLPTPPPRKLVAGLGQIAGRITDPSGAALPGATIDVRSGNTQRTATTDANGEYLVSGVPPGSATVTASLQGFSSAERQLAFGTGSAGQADMALGLGGLYETVTVQGDALALSTQSSSVARSKSASGYEKSAEPVQVPDQAQEFAPSANVFNLQRRVAGVVPVRVDIPRAGVSYRFVRPLVLDEETTVSFRYKAR